MDDVSFGYRLVGAGIVIAIVWAWASLQGTRAPWLLVVFALLVLAPSDRWRGGTAGGALADGVCLGLFAGVIASTAFGATSAISAVIGTGLGAAVTLGELVRVKRS